MAVYVTNRVYLRPGTKPTPYEIWDSRKPSVKYLKTFGSKCYILKDREHLSKFDSLSNEGSFLSYFLNGKAYIIYSISTSGVMESANVVVDHAGITNYFNDEDD